MRTSWSGPSIVDITGLATIVMVLLAVSLPVIQKSREAARNNVCANNLGTIGIASLEYEVINGQFPPYLGLPCNPDWPTYVCDYWELALEYQQTYSTVQLLPFIGENEIVDAIDPFAFENSNADLEQAGYSRFLGEWLYSFSSDTSLLGVEPLFFNNQIETYRCPSDRFSPTGAVTLGPHPTDRGWIRSYALPEFTNNSLSWLRSQRRTVTNYVSNGGAIAVTDTPSYPEHLGQWGPIRSRQSDSVDSIADGAANVILFGEHVGSNNYFPDAPLYADMRTSGLGGLAVGRADIYGITGGDDPVPFLGTAAKSHWLQFGSSHPRIVNTLRCDGAVQSVNRNIQPETFGRLCGVGDGEPLFDLRR